MIGRANLGIADCGLTDDAYSDRCEGGRNLCGLRIGWRLSGLRPHGRSLVSGSAELATSLLMGF